MALTIAAGQRHTPAQSGSIDQMTQSTATAAQAMSLTEHISTMAGGTATGFNVNNYSLGSGVDGLEKFIYQLATGESKLHLTMATGIHFFGTGTATGTGGSYAAHFSGIATGALTFTAKSQWVRMLGLDEGWTILGGNATCGTST